MISGLVGVLVALGIGIGALVGPNGIERGGNELPQLPGEHTALALRLVEIVTSESELITTIPKNTTPSTTSAAGASGSARGRITSVP